MRRDGRQENEIRPLTITPHYLAEVPGSCFIEMGRTKVICAVSIEEQVPPFLKNSGGGWLTAEYAMLPMSTPRRNARESVQGRQKGRTLEIQRLIGRSLRAVTDLSGFGERTVFVDCDVIQADGGTRTAAITGSFVALVEFFKYLRDKGEIENIPVFDSVAAISVGIVDGAVLLDLDYCEDSEAEVDANFVMTGNGKLIEVQATAERSPFGKKMLDGMIETAEKGIAELTVRQKGVLGVWK